ncbi:hypothetical protein ADEAN_000733500 [Angomonas deanei]|uniref:Uncharacterized protein n=1 Tax=Angomonas deanei TaxID=59799 RepID=A0A7G2CNR9_9TRYP|nr:hypothetical protein ADEAN_000733500 [Angomonas deanei]
MVPLERVTPLPHHNNNTNNNKNRRRHSDYLATSIVRIRDPFLKAKHRNFSTDRFNNNNNNNNPNAVVSPFHRIATNGESPLKGVSPRKILLPNENNNNNNHNNKEEEDPPSPDSNIIFKSPSAAVKKANHSNNTHCHPRRRSRLLFVVNNNNTNTNNTKKIKSTREAASPTTPHAPVLPALPTGEETNFYKKATYAYHSPTTEDHLSSSMDSMEEYLTRRERRELQPYKRHSI